MTEIEMLGTGRAYDGHRQGTGRAQGGNRLGSGWAQAGHRLGTGWRQATHRLIRAGHKLSTELATNSLTSTWQQTETLKDAVFGRSWIFPKESRREIETSRTEFGQQMRSG